MYCQHWWFVYEQQVDSPEKEDASTDANRLFTATTPNLISSTATGGGEDNTTTTTVSPDITITEELHIVSSSDEAAATTSSSQTAVMMSSDMSSSQQQLVTSTLVPVATLSPTVSTISAAQEVVSLEQYKQMQQQLESSERFIRQLQEDNHVMREQLDQLTSTVSCRTNLSVLVDHDDLTVPVQLV